MDYIERLEKNAEEFPEKRAVSDGGSHIYTYGALWDISGRVYRYLKARGIGREDFVMINLPRGAEVIVACVGVWRAGAAFVIVDENAAEERRDYIYADAGCCLCMDRQVFKEMLLCESMMGYEIVDDHDAAYLCYTSGTTGRPKGTLHEYGVIAQCRASYYHNGEYEFLPTDKYAMLSPLSFVAVIIVFPSLLYVGGELVIVPLDIVKHTEALKDFFACQKITVSFVTPTFLRVFQAFNPELRILYLASEPVKRVWFDQITVYNVYAQSETGFLTTTFQIDQPYDVTPIGKCVIPGIEIRLLDEDGQEVADGEIGEICFANIYFRGYQNQPEMTERTVIDGLFHSGDLGRKLPDGNIVLLGRVDDMVKINGNRVEPAEIESVLREIMQVDWVAVKCVDCGDSVRIAAYYTEEPKISMEEVKTIAALKLPYYMVPFHYRKIDSVSVNENGKFIRKNLPDPDFSAKTTYAAPTRALEQRLAGAFEEVLKLDRVGIDDDFYELGGDSLKCIEIISHLNMAGLSAEMVFRERTIRRIADKLAQGACSVTEKEATGSDAWIQSMKALEEKGCRLLPYQNYFLKRQQESLESHQYCILHLPLCMRYDSDVDTDRLAMAIKDALLAHPLLRTRIVQDEDGGVYQKVEETEPVLLSTEVVSEAEMPGILSSFLKPWHLFGAPLYKFQLLRTEQQVYFLMDFHHIIADGMSLHIFLQDVGRAYQGEILAHDAIYHYLSEVEQQDQSESFLLGKAYFEQMYENNTWSMLPKSDKKAEHYFLGSRKTCLDFDGALFERLEQKYKINHNVLFLAAALLAMAKYNDNMQVFGTWTFHGRDTKEKAHMAGPLLKDLPAGLRIDRGISIADLFDSLNQQIQGSIAHMSYPYTFSTGETYDSDNLCFLYQMDLYDFETHDLLAGRQIELLDPEATLAEQSFMVEVFRVRDSYYLKIEYVKEAYRSESIDRYVAYFENILAYLLHDDVRLIGYVRNENENAMLSKV